MDAQVTAAIITSSATVLAALVGVVVIRNRRRSRGGASDAVTEADSPRRSAVPLSERLRFVDLSVDESTDDWYEGVRDLGRTERDAGWYITRSSFDEGADLPIKATLLNSGDTPIVISRIGVEVVEAHNSWYTGRYYGQAPKAHEITAIGSYPLDLLSSAEIAAGAQTVMGADPDLDQWFAINGVCSLALRKPIYIEANGPLVYVTNLRDYDRGMPNDAVLRLIVFTDSGELRSGEILVTFGR